MLKAASALADAGYVVDEVEPPSVDLAAKTALEMLTVDSAAGIELMTMYPPEIQGVLRALIELAGNPDHMKGMLAYMTRQSLMRAWGEFQQEHPLIVAPIHTDIPFEATKGYSPAEVAARPTGIALPCRTRMAVLSCRRASAHGGLTAGDCPYSGRLSGCAANSSPTSSVA